jgi:hypothetical protein
VKTLLATVHVLLPLLVAMEILFIGLLLGYRFGNLWDYPMEGSHITIGRAACEACSATWNLGTNPAFALGPGKTLIELAGRRTFLSKLTSSQQTGIKYASPNIGPYLCYFLLQFLSSSAADKHAAYRAVTQ